MKKLSKIMTYSAVIIGLISAVFIIMLCTKGQAVIESDPAAQASTIWPLFYITGLLFLVSVLSIAFFVIGTWIKNPKSFTQALIYIGAFAAVVIVAYLFTNSDPVTLADGKESTTSDSFIADFGLYMTYILGGLSIIAVVFGGVLKIFK